LAGSSAPRNARGWCRASKRIPHEFAGQELLNLSAAPVWSEEYGLTPRRVVLRVYLAASGDSWVVIPGGLARVSPSIDTPVVSMQRGGGSKDTWVLSERPGGQRLVCSGRAMCRWN
jgi:uncharacterized circularly permuted ATP-grasp superfamily protein